MAIILDGKNLRNEIAAKLKAVVDEKLEKGFVKPSLAIVQIGNNKESETYIRNKKRFGESIGVNVLHVHLPEEIEQTEVQKEIKNLNEDESVDGIILQLPIPKHLHKEMLIESISLKKDVDGLTSRSVKGLWIDSGTSLMPATTRGILSLLKKYDVSLSGKKVVVVGRSALVGKPTALALLNKGATVTICHSETKDLEAQTVEADIIVAAVGRPRLISRHHVRPGQIIIDVGTTIENPDDRKCVGDADFEDIKDIVAMISPVPGGVGPMTVASLFENVVDVYLRKTMI
ncbi:MAG TPA: bifunctional 5,10-methylenetetrahydrofolate dehydrogenase/5,10-methenyltetrahydrofolate cyclohydrolase [Candidatus Paceibacterota bacterium]